jgi:hypothetical protein
LVTELVGQQIAEKQAIEFAGLNGSCAREEFDHSVNAARYAKQLVGLPAPPDKDGGAQTLFDWALRDPAIFWLVAHSHRSAKDVDALKILEEFAGTDLPMILTKYAKPSDDCFRAACEALFRFDNALIRDPAQQHPAADVLAHFQDSDQFKEQLAKHGARLVPAVSTGLDPVPILEAIEKNEKDIDKYVTNDGTPITGKPWWTWVPGGSVVYVVRELGEGRTVDTEDMIWAATDVLILLPAAATASKAGVTIRLVPRAGRGVVALGKPAIARGAERVAAEATAGSLARKWTFREACVLLRSAGVKLSSHALEIGKATAEGISKIAATYPMAASAAGIAVLANVFKKSAAEIADNAMSWIGDRIKEAASVVSGTAIDSVSEALDRVLGELQKLKLGGAMSAAVYHLLVTLIWIAAVGLPLILLKRLLPDVFNLLQAVVVALLRAIGALAATLARSLLPRPKTAK